jgi:hypothetical protein
MKIYKVPVSWSVGGTVSVEANSVEEACELAYDILLDLVDDVDYIEDSFEVDKECAFALAREEENE